MKLCVFQGTFNPIHKAHIKVVDFILKNYDFDKILIIPAFKPPHKNIDDKTATHRLNMAKLAFKNINRVEVSDIEFQRNEKSYTYITICELYKKYNVEGKISFIIGTDAFKNIETWYNANKLKTLIKFIVFERENDFSPSKYEYLKKKGYDFEFELLPFENISSSEIRKKIKYGISIEKDVNKDIEEYIKKYELYKS